MSEIVDPVERRAQLVPSGLKCRDLLPERVVLALGADAKCG
jgi:hypothetical protein